MTHKTIAVVGHVDHGKTSLVKALTAVDTDTLREERERGLTISLGFANRLTPAGQIHFIDAPGHSEFIRTTASGLSGADAILLVVSAIEGIQAQTIEHVKIARLMGIDRFIVALTKADLANVETIDQARAAIKVMLSDYEIDSIAITACSTRVPDGIEDLAAVLDEQLTVPAQRPVLQGFYLPLDRVFSAQGTGTIVAGTLIGGSLNVDATAKIEPVGTATSVRGLQINGQAVATATPGSRVAINLRGVEAGTLKKGHVLCAADQFEPSDRFDVSQDMIGAADSTLKHMDHVMVLWGTGYAPARVRLFASVARTREDRFAQLEFTSPQIAFAGQRFALRRPATAETVLGGTILDPMATPVPRDKSRHVAVLKSIALGDPQAIADAMADRDEGCVDLRVLSRVSRTPLSGLQDHLDDDFEIDLPDMAIRTRELETVETEYLETLNAFHLKRPGRPHHVKDTIHSTLRNFPAALIHHAEAGLLAAGKLSAHENSVAVPEHAPLNMMSPAERAAFGEAEQRLGEMALAPKPLFGDAATTDEQEDMIELLIWNGKAIRLYNHALKQHILLHADAVGSALEKLHRAFPGAESFTTSDARKALGTNRKTIVPLLEHFDRLGATQRKGDQRFIPQ